MHVAIEYILVVAAGLLIMSVIASKASTRFGIPALVLFLGIGMLAGSEGPGGIYFDDAALAQAIGVVSLMFILFSGGLATDWHAIRPVLGRGLALANVGVALSALMMGLFASYVLGFSWLEGLLLGVIVSSTDAAAVFAVLRASGVDLADDLEPLIELESGSNDPIAVFLTAAVTSLLLHPGASVLALVPEFILEMVLGTVAGVVMGRVMALAINRLRLTAEGLYPVLMIAMVLLTYGGTAALGGNGFLAVYLAGIVVGNLDFVHKRSLILFHDGLAWLVQIAMFLTLGLLVFPSRLLPVAGSGLLAAAFLIVLARPLSVILALAPFRMRLREMLMVSWVGLRGAVPIVLATFPLLAGLPHADLIFNMVFFIVVTSVLLQGTSIPLVGRLLGVGSPPVAPRATRLFVPRVTVRSHVAEFEIDARSRFRGATVLDLGLPPGALVVAINRGSDRIVPGGGTVLRAGDQLLILGDDPVLEEVQRHLTDVERPA
ncbi:MAG TPA: potassium/proton antiporter [Kouleothrix sp.]|uniref:potassium/proton antiporter n=1 Tax=Kouleothrix sp. TaxID=2779161 RepID=UPI002CE6E6BE|nr:potassium/proton antiporter [Kouleothrix sp.]HRC76012.1 potassium/proton antiporter [Kouleothrix sp.]